MRWAIIGKATNYEISDTGLVRNRKTGLIRKLSFSDGYCSVGIVRNGKFRMCSVHRLVVEAFIAKIPVNREVNHINGIRHDNRVENLEIVTRLRNVQHSWERRMSELYAKLIAEKPHIKQLIDRARQKRLNLSTQDK
jgi:hypothetical protein